MRIAAFALQRLGHLLGRPDWLAAAEGTLRAAWHGLAQRPQAHVAMLAALEELLHPPQIIILRGAEDADRAWRAQLARLYAPRRLVLAVPARDAGSAGGPGGQARAGMRRWPMCARAASARRRLRRWRS